MTIAFDANTIHVYRGRPSKRTVYIDKDGLTRISVNWTEWLGTDTIASSTWSVEDNNSILTLSDTDLDTVATEAHVSSSTRHTDIYVKNAITTALGEIATQSIRVITERIA